MNKYRLLTIVGARPQIIKSAAISRAIKLLFNDRIEEHVLHTGQHYDKNMSGSFFDELDIRQPDINLHCGSGNHGEQTAKMISGIEQILQNERFDGVILYGDTNSTLAGAVAAAKLQIPIFHVEAGLRSYDMTMPEEQNRIVCDHLSAVLFAPTQTAVGNLTREGLTDSRALFNNGKKRRVVLSGDVMYDNSVYFASRAGQKSPILQKLNLQPKNFVLATIHRDNNTDNARRLESIIKAMLTIANDYNMQVVFPIHPRTRKVLTTALSDHIYKELISSDKIKVIEPVSFFDTIVLEKNARVVMTDSGGVQKEAFFYCTPSIILRSQTEWVEIIDAQAGILADADCARIVKAYNDLADRHVEFPPLFGDGHAAEKILTEITNYLS